MASSERNRDAIYANFDAFLKVAIYEFYKNNGRERKGDFLALVIASGEIAALATDAVTTGKGLKRLAIGAAGVIALRVGLKYALSGPLGAILAAGAMVSLTTYLVRHHGEIGDKIARYRQIVGKTRSDYERLQQDYCQDRFDEEQRALMVDGLMQRFLAELVV